MKKNLVLLALCLALPALAGGNSQIISAQSPLSLTNGVMSIPVAGSSQAGYLLSSDWNTFNNKLTGTIANLSSPTTGITITGGANSVLGSGTTISIQTATGSQPGLLSAADWATFNGKQSALTFGNLTSGTSGVTVTGGTGAVVGAGTTVSVQSATDSQPGLLTAADHAQLTTNTANIASNTSAIATKAPTASPVFTGPVKEGNYHLEPSENNAGNSSTAQTIDWSTGSAQLSTLTGNVTYTFSNGVAGGAYVLRIATGAGSFTATWPAAVKWAGGTAPTITTTASKVDLINFYYDGTSWYGSFTQNY